MSEEAKSEQPPLQGVGFWLRALARIIDMAFHFLAMLIAMVPTAIFLSELAVSRHLHSNFYIARLDNFSIVALLLSFMGAILFHTLSEGLNGSSLGKRICGLVVTTDTLTNCSLKSALGRSVAFYLDGLFFGAIAAGEMQSSSLRQRYGDKWNHTIVVRRANLPSSFEPKHRFMRVLLLATFVDVLFLFSGFVFKTLW